MVFVTSSFKEKNLFVNWPEFRLKRTAQPSQSRWFQEMDVALCAMHIVHENSQLIKPAR